ncbi:DNA repair protein RecO [Patescibacteria group bacterium]|nr:DNA repair protein RecO [Patescibacteria group bacterium]
MQGIVIKRIQFLENDLLVNILCNEGGNIQAVARGGQKFESKMAAHLEPLNLINVDLIVGKKLNYIRNIYSVKCFCELKANIELIDIAMRAIFFINKIIKPNIENPKVLYLLFELLSILDNTELSSKIDKKLLLHLFLYKLHFIESLLPEEQDYNTYCLNEKLNSSSITYADLNRIIKDKNLATLIHIPHVKGTITALNNYSSYFENCFV